MLYIMWLLMIILDPNDLVSGAIYHRYGKRHVDRFRHAKVVVRDDKRNRQKTYAPASYRTDLFKSLHRIVGGTDCIRSDCVYQAALYFDGHQHCGGAVIGEEWILTAGHCVKGLDVRDLSVGIGSYATGGAGEQKYGVAETFVHEDYWVEDDHPFNDIALLKLERAIVRNKRVMKVKLSDTRPKDGSFVTISGYGAHNENDLAQNIRLSKVQLTVYGASRCQRSIRDKEPGIRVFALDQFCAADPDNNKKDACQGDSGGPVIQGDRLVGIVSWGIGCSRPDLPGFYTDVVFHKQWIYSISGIN